MASVTLLSLYHMSHQCHLIMSVNLVTPVSTCHMIHHCRLPENITHLFDTISNT